MRYPLLLAFLALLVISPRLCAQQVKLGFNADITDPVACEGVVYVGCYDGKLHAVKATDGSAVPGFPVDIGAAMGDGSYPVGRPAVYYGSLGKAIYLATSKGGVVKVWPDGTIAWVSRVEGSSIPTYADTPAVTPDGEVIAPRYFSGGGHIVKMRESDGTVVMTSATLTKLSAYSPAVVDNNIYTCVSQSANNLGVIVLNRSDLTVKASAFAPPQGWSPPYVRGDGVFFGTASFASSIVKLNSATLALDLRFGPAEHPGRVIIGSLDLGAYAEPSASPASADQDPGGTIYASVQNSYTGMVVGIDAVTGSVRGLYDGTNGSPGMCVSSRNVAAYAAGNTMNCST
jgi:outer membrane protein assembly factor BamB